MQVSPGAAATARWPRPHSLSQERTDSYLDIWMIYVYGHSVQVARIRLCTLPVCISCSNKVYYYLIIYRLFIANGINIGR